MRTSIAVPAVLALSLSLGCGQSESPTSPSITPTFSASQKAGESTPAATAPAVPLQGRFDGTFRVSGAPPVIDVVLDATGVATQLGRFTQHFEHQASFIDNTGRGDAVFVAANGDRLLTDVTGIATPQETPGVLFIVETHTIYGGTGRFAAATGTFTVNRAAALTSPETGTTEGTLQGSISLR